MSQGWIVWKLQKIVIQDKEDSFNDIKERIAQNGDINRDGRINAVDGALFLQLSANVDNVANEKYSRARELLKPYLYSGLVGDKEYPITLRAGCAPEDLVFDRASWSYYIKT